MATLLADIRVAIRRLARAPGFALTVVGVLALGIGANASVFSALDQAVLRPLPYADPGRLAMLWEDYSAFGTPQNNVSPATFLDWRRRTRAFADLGAIRIAAKTFAESGAPEDVLGAGVTANLLPIIGVKPTLGRTFTVEEEPPGNRVVVLSEGVWRRRFGGDEGIVGRSIVMSGEPYTVIGVMPRGFHFPDARTEFWMPIGLQPQQLTARNSHYLRVVGRLRTDATWITAHEEMRAIAAQLAEEYPRTNGRVGIRVTPLTEQVTGDASHALSLLLGAAGCVLLIACANVANLLLARAAGRRREIAVRLALGASRGRLVRHMLTESLLLAAAGGVAGLVAARWSVRALTRFVPAALSTTIDLHLDWRAVAFTTVVTIATALAVGLTPSIRIASRASLDSLRARLGVGDDRRGTRLRRGLVVVEVAVALVLAVSAALLIETLAHLRTVDPGFLADHVLTAQIVSPFPKYVDASRRQQFYLTLIDRMKTLPGVIGVGLTSDLPYTSRANYMSLGIEGQTVSRGLAQDALFRLVSTNYLQVIDATLREGRLFDDNDRAGAQPVVVVNAALARLYWPAESALGHRIDTGTGNGAPLWMTIVGVIEDVKEQGLDYGPRAAVYVPFTQTTIGFFLPSEIALRTTVPPETLAAALPQAVWAIDPEQPVSQIRTLDDIVDNELGDRQRMLTLIGVFATVALVLAALGIYSVVSYLVSERRREIGLRIAIGASAGVVLRDVLRQSATLAVVGVMIGLGAALVVTRWLGTLLFHVSPVDPAVLSVVSLLLIVVSLVAALVPAHRAAAIDPMTALRAD